MVLDAESSAGPEAQQGSGRPDGGRIQRLQAFEQGFRLVQRQQRLAQGLGDRGQGQAQVHRPRELFFGGGVFGTRKLYFTQQAAALGILWLGLHHVLRRDDGGFEVSLGLGIPGALQPLFGTRLATTDKQPSGTHHQRQVPNTHHESHHSCPYLLG